MQRTFIALAVLGLTGLNALAAPVQATIENETHATRCAEEDNVSLNLSGAAIRRFRVEALPPAYLASIDQDRTAPDFTNCNFDGGAHPTDPRHTFKERRAVLHDGPRWQIVGITLPSFWRPQRVPLRVDGRRDRGFHMIQLFDKTGAKPLEALVMYPSDGYWRIKPLPAPRFGDGVYGSSFVMGPVEQAGRPVATITSIAIDTRPSLRFMLKFANGGTARVDVREVSEARTALDVSLEPGRKQGPRFAVLRSMYVEADNADMSEVWWKTAPDAAPQTRALPEVSKLEAAEVRFGRRIPSRHNTSAPDIRFGDFQSRSPR
ncbi:hypothetical protein GCM10023165_10780 [Variovorax defluvii]|uniref:Uncharacterized protein n=1 Tax=Variovorax defluvii TaxID=913761 RepID=A0ABP8H5W2_9BURK